MKFNVACSIASSDEYAWLMNITMDSEELDVLTSNNSFPGVDNILVIVCND